MSGDSGPDGSVFEQRFGRPPQWRVSAPGRVNLIGDHTDYNEGFVLPMAIDRRTRIEAAPRGDGRAVVFSAAQADPIRFEVSANLKPERTGAWGNYVRGPVALWCRRGLPVRGFDAWVTSDVPTGAGLSSSAALEVATVTLLEAMTGSKLEPIDKARLCQQAEHEFAGMPCGVMDQMISVLGRAGHALLIDCRSLEATPVPIDVDHVEVLVIDSATKHELVGSPYADRREQCAQAARLLGVDRLRDATPALLRSGEARLDAVTAKRARHVVTENERVLQAVRALAEQGWDRLGALMFASHASLSRDYEVSTPELDHLVELARGCCDEGVIGARMTGGGFGGCVVIVTRAGTSDAIGSRIAERYKQDKGISPTLYLVHPSIGATQDSD